MRKPKLIHLILLKGTPKITLFLNPLDDVRMLAVG